MEFDYLARLLAVDELVARIDRVEERLSEALLLDGVGLGPPSTRMALSGGKRLRPVMVIAAAHVFDVFDDRVISGAAAVELVQVGSLVHDDIFDKAATRRGVPTINATDGEEPAILAGDYILARAGVEAARVSAEAARVLARTVIELCVGQHQETVQLEDRHRTIEQHFASIEAKTAALFDVSARMGGLAADAPPELVDALGIYARAFGMSFQIVDDVLDLVADPERLGKPVGSDLRAGVYTLPVLHALAGDRGDELSALLDGPVDYETSAHASRLVAASGGIEHALAVALDFEKSAVSALDTFDDHPTVQGLRRLPEDYRVWALSTLGDDLEIGPVGV
ncbi:MAG: polyprenyl synthetase family protein [Acidimicrobiales bacterium]|nr:polyprenyl synthetase family protein [Acidimicrobiales bacterium]